MSSTTKSPRPPRTRPGNGRASGAPKPSADAPPPAKPHPGQAAAAAAPNPFAGTLTPTPAAAPPAPAFGTYPGLPPGALDAPTVIDAAEFTAGFGESIQNTLDLSTWVGGLDLATALDRLEAEVAKAVESEDKLRDKTRALVFPLLKENGGGVFEVTRGQLECAQRDTLLSGAVEAVDGLCALHDTLPLTVAQIGVCLTSYGGDQTAAAGGAASWGHRLYRRDVRIENGDPVEEALAILEKRQTRADLHHQGRRDLLSHLFRRGILAWSQRAALVERSTKPWRMGHGHPAPHELLTGSGNMELLHSSLDLLRRLVLDHKRFLFVPSECGDRFLMTVGNALPPSHFAIVEPAERRMKSLVQEGHLIGHHFRAAQDFLEDAGPRIMAGVYRTFPDTPPQVFYAHRDYAQDAALIVMADSLLQSHHTFPTLLNLARTVCTEVFGAEGFNATVQAAYAGRGCPLRYVSERQTKR